MLYILFWEVLFPLHSLFIHIIPVTHSGSLIFNSSKIRCIQHSKLVQWSYHFWLITLGAFYCLFFQRSFPKAPRENDKIFLPLIHLYYWATDYRICPHHLSHTHIWFAVPRNLAWVWLGQKKPNCGLVSRHIYVKNIKQFSSQLV